MDAGSIERLFIRQGETAGAPQVRRLEGLIARQMPLRAPGVVRTMLPWGYLTRYRSAGGVGGTSPIFAPSISGSAAAGFSVSWQQGTIEGVEPSIGGVPISGNRDATGKVIGKPPVFAVPASAFNAAGEAKIYFRGTINQLWYVQTVEPFASADAPAAKEWTCYKLALLLYADGSYWRALYANQGHLAIQRRATSGTATHLFWSKM